MLNHGFISFFDANTYEVRPDNSVVYQQPSGGYRDGRAEIRPNGRIVIRDAVNSALLATIKPLLARSFYVTAEMSTTGKKYSTAEELNSPHLGE